VVELYRIKEKKSSPSHPNLDKPILSDRGTGRSGRRPTVLVVLVAEAAAEEQHDQSEERDDTGFPLVAQPPRPGLLDDVITYLLQHQKEASVVDSLAASVHYRNRRSPSWARFNSGSRFEGSLR
jgi:hypothetical protein